MGTIDRLFNRQRSVHEILGGGLVADVILWRRKNLTRGILLAALAAWVVFERSGYTLVSLVSSVLLLLITILFLWARSAAILNRPAPSLPELQISEEMMEGLASLVRTHTNSLLSSFMDIALGKDSGLYMKVAGSLFLLSVLGGLTDFLTLCYTSLVVIFTIPAIYEKYEEHVDGHMMKGYHNLVQFYAKLYGRCSGKVQQWISEAKKLN
ncbi:hypothetical protein MLD38_029856 [Melastoma candidum]|uniref:Uncharacterized protein n=1 Tax=Melastoma candidum TaxID=119954 RepID=A0ACB9N6J9_9MYRT|nr:hypothetical protein MLD38_029856 [Melastoma candidum]